MIVDTSAVVAVIKREPGWEAIDRSLASAAGPRMSAGTYLELGIVVDQAGDPALSRQLDALLRDWGVALEPVTAGHAKTATSAAGRAIERASTSVTASPTPWLPKPASRSCSSETTSPRRTSLRL